MKHELMSVKQELLAVEVKLNDQINANSEKDKVVQNYASLVEVLEVGKKELKAKADKYSITINRMRSVMRGEATVGSSVLGSSNSDKESEEITKLKSQLKEAKSKLTESEKARRNLAQEVEKVERRFNDEVNRSDEERKLREQLADKIKQLADAKKESKKAEATNGNLLKEIQDKKIQKLQR